MTVLTIGRDAQGIVCLVLNRPTRHNALNDELVDALNSAILDCAQDPQVRVVVLTGSGRSFCSGLDITWLSRVAECSSGGVAEQMQVLFRTIARCPKPVIAAVNGAAFGGGAGLVACCDIAVAARGATFAFTELRLGLVPAVISPYVIDAIGVRQARRYFLDGTRIDAERARCLGLVHEVADDALLDEVVSERIVALLKAGPEAVATCKALLARLVERDDGIHDAILETFADRAASKEGQEGMTAFVERRRATWMMDEA